MTSTRVDRKYLLPEDELENVLSTNSNLWTTESVAGLTTQRYETMYFDTPELTFFHAARGQRPQRCKVRVRYYLDTDDRFIEVKRRNTRDETVKVRQPWAGSIAQAGHFLHESLGSSATVMDLLVDHLVPTAQTAYERVALLLSSGGRMTIDRQLMVGRHDALTHRLFDDGSNLVIVETKSTGQSPTAMDRALWGQNFRPLSLSKYALAIASFRPDLPLNRWTQVASRLSPQSPLLTASC